MSGAVITKAGSVISACTGEPSPGMWISGQHHVADDLRCMDKTTTLHVAGLDSDVGLKVQTAQIQQLFQQTWLGLIGMVVVAMSACIVQWPVIQHWKLLGWVGLSLLITLARVSLCVAFRRKAPSGKDIFRWAAWHVAGAIASGVLWAIPSIWMWPADHPVHQLVWPICIVSLSAAAVASYSSWTLSYLAYPLLSVVPLSLRLIWEGGTVYPVLGTLGLFFTTFLVHTGKDMHDATRQAFVMGIRNKALSRYLSREKAKQETLTRELQAAHDQLEQLSLTDELTGVWNRRYFNATVPELLSRMVRSRHGGSDDASEDVGATIEMLFMMVDLDHFKRVNDTYGHSAGDEVLRQMCILLSRSCRGTDTIVRWGGEEFLVVARNLKSGSYAGLLERIRHTVETHRFDIGHGTSISVTCSIGAAAFPPLSDEPETFNWKTVVDIADVCLYSAKRTARNAWVGVIPTPQTTVEEFTHNLSERLPALIDQGKWTLSTSLPDNIPISWPA